MGNSLCCTTNQHENMAPHQAPIGSLHASQRLPNCKSSQLIAPEEAYSCHTDTPRLSLKNDSDWGRKLSHGNPLSRPSRYVYKPQPLPQRRSSDSGKPSAGGGSIYFLGCGGCSQRDNLSTLDPPYYGRENERDDPIRNQTVFSEDEMDIPIYSSRALNGPEFSNRNLRKKPPLKKKVRRRPSIQEDQISDFRLEEQAPSAGRPPVEPIASPQVQEPKILSSRTALTGQPKASVRDKGRDPKLTPQMTSKQDIFRQMHGDDGSSSNQRNSFRNLQARPTAKTFLNSRSRVNSGEAGHILPEGATLTTRVIQQPMSNYIASARSNQGDDLHHSQQHPPEREERAQSLQYDLYNSAYTERKRSASIPLLCNMPSGRRRSTSRHKAVQAKKKGRCQQVFSFDTFHPVSQVRFSQRRFLGFRSRTEFDKKRILLASEREFSIHGYETLMSNSSYELYSEKLCGHLEIKYIDFIEDVVPKYLVMVVNDMRERKSYLYVKHLVKNKKYFQRPAKDPLFSDNVILERNECEEASFVANSDVFQAMAFQSNDYKEEINENLKKGLIRKERRRSHENFELVSNSKQNQKKFEEVIQLSKSSKLTKFLHQEHKVEDKMSAYPYALEDFGVLELQEYVGMAQTANNSKHSSNMQIYTVDSSDPGHIKMTVYKVKRSYQTSSQIAREKLDQERDQIKKQAEAVGADLHFFHQQRFHQLMNKQEAMDKSTYRLLSFRLSKYSTVRLDYVPANIEFIDPYIVLTYGANSSSMFSSEHEGGRFCSDVIPYVDIFEKSGEPVRRINVGDLLKEYKLTFQTITHVKLPKLKWSLRDNIDSQLRSLAKTTCQSGAENSDSEEEMMSMKGAKKDRKAHTLEELSRVVIVGECYLGTLDSCDQLYDSLRVGESGSAELGPAVSLTTSPFVMVLNCKADPKAKIRSLQSTYSTQSPTKLKGLMLKNISKPKPELIKVIRLPEIEPATNDPHDPAQSLAQQVLNNRITSVQFGPYDNGYLVMGTLSGHLLQFDPISLNRINTQRIFEPEGNPDLFQILEDFNSPEPEMSQQSFLHKQASLVHRLQEEYLGNEVISIDLDPTQMIIAGSREGRAVGLNIVKQEKQYVYLELGAREYCTVALNRGRKPKQ